MSKRLLPLCTVAAISTARLPNGTAPWVAAVAVSCAAGMAVVAAGWSCNCGVVLTICWPASAGLAGTAVAAAWSWDAAATVVADVAPVPAASLFAALAVVPSGLVSSLVAGGWALAFAPAAGDGVEVEVAAGSAAPGLVPVAVVAAAAVVPVAVGVLAVVFPATGGAAAIAAAMALSVCAVAAWAVAAACAVAPVCAAAAFSAVWAVVESAASVDAACCALNAAAVIVSGVAAPALPVAAGVVATVVDGATGTGMITAMAVTGTAACWDEPEAATVAGSEALSSLAEESFLPGLLPSVLEVFDAASLLAVLAPPPGLAGALLRSGGATFEVVAEFEVVSDWFWLGEDWVSAVADRSSLCRCGGAGAGASGGAGMGAGLLLALSAAMLLSTSAAKLLSPED